MLECFSLLGALAEVTTTIELGTSVANVWNRQVGTLVTAAASIANISGRQTYLGLGAGSSPTSVWAAEQRAVGAHVEPSLEQRHARVQEVLDLSAAMWRRGRAEQYETFPLPSPVPKRIVGVNSVGLSRLAGRAADGVNIPWNHVHRDEFLAAANEEAGRRQFLRTAYAVYEPHLLDADHPERVAMSERNIDRLVLAALGDERPFD